ncbi:MAG: Uma2 family endonuclease [Thiothrix sp.]|nr:Uma2 family endonuclease [Thiothrix sp.]HPE60049.1 Uma2 family endonuclease [Thiolinea sp.]
MQWHEVCAHPDLQNLPFKLELNEYGQIVMSPARVYHSILQGEIAALLKSQRSEGRVLTECAIHTHKGTKVADVAWASPAIFERIKQEIECSIAPDICIEILSSANTNREMEDKISLYFSRGAKEVWLCDPEGRITFHIPAEVLSQSVMFPGFPQQVVY